MDSQIIANALATLTIVGGLLAFVVHRLDKRFDTLEGRLGERIDLKLDPINVRLAHLEDDMSMVKHHLFGTPAA